MQAGVSVERPPAGVTDVAFRADIAEPAVAGDAAAIAAAVPTVTAITAVAAIATAVAAVSAAITAVTVEAAAESTTVISAEAAEAPTFSVARPAQAAKSSNRQCPNSPMHNKLRESFAGDRLIDPDALSS